ncbi:hypothetical protein CMV_000070 [Castanea mollissima]|uniref:Uncharacterized protein n=1 Tax=Castanea mollissima TaxID=60419 RepID=A0A8J4VZ85_9ROSI|nr:hypothetical protein CMV_000070 [Castanea mollissima]
MEKNPFQHTHQYPWIKIIKVEIIKLPNSYNDHGQWRGDIDIYYTWEKITEIKGSVFATVTELYLTGEESEMPRYFSEDSDAVHLKWAWCFGLDRWRLLGME